jgi:methionyl aminopeptidase
MISIKDQHAIDVMAVAGRLLSHIFVAMEQHMVPGMNALSLDTWIAEELKRNRFVSQMKGYQGYQHVSCVSINDEVVHGIPQAHKVFKEGDLVKVDVCASLDGYCADMARCFFVGSRIDDNARRLVEVAYRALDKGIEKAVPGNHVSDISAAIQQEVEKHGFGVVRIFAGHGIGKYMHEDPEILNYGLPGRGPRLKAGMAFALEPMITYGHYDLYIEKDGWTAKTIDKSLAAHVEDTVVITEQGPRIVTRAN